MSVPRPWPRRRPLWQLWLAAGWLAIAAGTFGEAVLHDHLHASTWLIGAVAVLNAALAFMTWRRAVGAFDRQTERLGSVAAEPPAGPD